MLDGRLDLENEVRELFIAKLKEFAKFCAEMAIDENEIERDPWASEKGKDYIEGYNAGVTDGVDGALSMFIEEHGY